MPRWIETQAALVGSQDPIGIVSREEYASKGDRADCTREGNKGPGYPFLFRNDTFLVFLSPLNFECFGKDLDELDLESGCTPGRHAVIDISIVQQ